MNKDKIIFKYISMKRLKGIDKRYIKLICVFLGGFESLYKCIT